MIEASNVINFQEAVARLEPYRRRNVSAPNSTILSISHFLHDLAEDVEKNGCGDRLSQDETDLLRSLDERLRFFIQHGSLSISRSEIDMVGDWFIDMMPESHKERGDVSSALINLDSQFVKQAGGIENPDFCEMIQGAVKK